MLNHLIIAEKGTNIPLYSTFVSEGKDALKFLHNAYDVMNEEQRKRVFVSGMFQDKLVFGNIDECIDFLNNFKNTKKRKEDGKKEKELVN